jgi:hypothetical protein
MLVLLSPPRLYLSICSSIGLFCIAQGGLQILMPQPLANGRQAHPTIDKFSGMRMPQLMERAGDTYL